MLRAEAKVKESWDHTASLMALIANVNRDPKKGRALKPKDFHPFYSSRRRSRVSVEQLSREMTKIARGKAGKPHG
jgi:hypothetical protein